MRRIVFVVRLLTIWMGFAGGPVFATRSWIGGTGPWTTPGNWSGGVVPEAEMALLQGGTATVSSAVGNAGYNQIQSAGKLDILAGGAFVDTNRFYVGGQNAASGTGTVQVASGGCLVTRGVVVVGGSSNPLMPNAGIVEVSGGCWTNLGQSIAVARKDAGSAGTLRVAGGVVYSSQSIVLGRAENGFPGGDAGLVFSGGTLKVLGDIADQGGTATFAVVGNGAGSSIEIGRLLFDEDDSTLSMTIASNGVTPIIASGNSVLNGELALEGDGLASNDVGSVHELIRVVSGTLDIGGLAVRNSGGNVFSVEKVADGSGEKLLATLVEDSSGVVDYYLEQVAALPEGTPDEKIKKTVLEWTLNKARREYGEGDVSTHDALVDDVALAIDQPIGQPVAVSTNIVPPIQIANGNPYWTLLTNRLDRATPVSDRMHADDWAVCSVQSPLFQDANLMDLLLSDLDAVLSVNPMAYSDANILIFDAEQAFDTFDMVVSTFPDLIVPSLQAVWLERMNLYMEEIYSLRGNPAFNDRLHGLNYPNPDAHALVAAGIANHYFDVAEWRTYETNLLDGLDAHLYPDGGWSYLFEGNEEPSYHGVVLSGLIRYWERTGSARAYAMLVKSAPYYPLSVEKGGVAESSSSPYWKHRWDMVAPWFMGAVAGIAGGPENHRQAGELLAFNAAAGVDLMAPEVEINSDMLRMAASWYRTNIAEVALADNYVKYDRNIEGPRGRFGAWSFCATGRDWDRDRGKYTFAGAMAIDESRGGYPLGGALQIAMNRTYCDAEGGNYILGMYDENSMVVDSRFSVFCTKYNLQLPIPSGGYSQPQPWIGKQQWIMTPERVVGFAQIEPDGSQVSYGLEGVIRIGSGRGLPLENLAASTFSDLGGGAFRMGNLRLDLLDHNYAQVATDSDLFDYRGDSVDIVLRDSVRVSGGSQTYSGTGNWYCIEARPDGAAPAEDVQHWESNGVFHLYVQEASNRYYLVIHNTLPSTHRFTLDQVTNHIAVAMPFHYYLDDAEPVLSGTEGFAVDIPSMQQLTLVWGNGLVDDFLDSDGDGVVDVLENLNLELESGGGRIGFRFTAGVPDYAGQPAFYVIDSKTNLQDHAWMPFLSDIPLNGEQFATNLPMEWPTIFYRIGVEQAN